MGDHPSGKPTSGVDVALVFVALLIVLGMLLARPLGHPLPHLVSLLTWLAVPTTCALWLAGRRAPALLGLTPIDVRGVAVACIGSLAMLAGLALTSERGPHFDPWTLWDGAIRPALVEELLFRGLAFGVLFWRARWSFRTAMLTTGAIFGLFHLPGAIAAGHLEQAWGAALLTGAGGCWYAWLYVRWSRSLWVPIAAHMTMNAWWMLYSAGPTAAAGGIGTTVGRVAAIVVVTVATARLTKRPPSQS